MFQFTTTNVINSNVDLTTGKELWSAQSADDTNGLVASLNIKRVNNFKQPNVVHIFKSEYTAPKNAKATLDFSQVTGAKRVRLIDFLSISVLLRVVRALTTLTIWYSRENHYL